MFWLLNPLDLELILREEIESANSVKIFVNKGIRFVKEREVSINSDLIDKHKVIVPYAFGSGDPSSDKLKPIYSPPGTCCSETYLVLGPLDDRAQCENLMSFLNTKFFHFCITLKKILNMQQEMHMS